jgi:hypothetical protein
VNKYFYKYKSHYSSIFLGAYLFLISLTIFHYHHYDFRQGNYNLEQIPESQSPNPFDKFTDVNSECIVAHFSNTIDNINYVPVISSEIADYCVFISLNKNNNVPKQEYNYKHHLRAPPSIFS